METQQTAKMEFLNSVDDALKPIANTLIDSLIHNNPNFDFAIKWKRLTFALNHDFHHWLCAVQSMKKSIGLVFHFGGLLDDPNKFFIKGESRFLRKIEYKSIEEIDTSSIQFFIDQAIGRLEYFKANWRELNKAGDRE